MSPKKPKKPKMKTNRAAAKRFKKTGTGLVVYSPEGHRHGLSNKSRKHNRKLRASRTMTKSDQRLVDRLIPYL